MESERNLMTTTEANGKLCFFAREDLDAWLRRVRVKSQEEIDSGAARYLVGRERNR